METLAAMLSRRSIRKYTDQPVGDDVIERLLRAGMAAPSAHNEQPWHFIVIRDRALLDEITEIHPYAKMLRQAPVALAVCADHKLEKDAEADYWVQDCAAATENILLAAHAQGLGACWLGIHPRMQRKEAISKFLKLPEHVSPFGLIALGWPGEEKKPSDRFNSERVHQNRW